MSPIHFPASTKTRAARAAPIPFTPRASIFKMPRKVNSNEFWSSEALCAIDTPLPSSSFREGAEGAFMFA